MTLGGMTWRRPDDHSVIAGFDGEVLGDMDGEDLRMTCLPLQELGRLMLDVYREKYRREVSWGHKVVAVGQNGDKAWVEVETAGGIQRVEADYVAGCDGANSCVRKSLFGNDFPGFTWDNKQIVATNVRVSTSPIANPRD